MLSLILWIAEIFLGLQILVGISSEEYIHSPEVFIAKLIILLVVVVIHKIIGGSFITIKPIKKEG